ncbi:MAG: ATP-binding cassette domain-containing protein, partial [Thermomicrobiales bacterium]
MAQIRFDRVSKRFGSQHQLAVDNLNLDVHDKELLTLVGPSGCGKSTTLNMLAGLEDPSEGLISIDDRVVNQVPPGARDIAMVFQSYAL